MKSCSERKECMSKIICKNTCPYNVKQALMSLEFILFLQYKREVK